MAGERKVGYVFNRENDLDGAILAGRAYNINNTPQDGSSPKRATPIFAQVDTGESGFNVTATQVVWDSSLNSGDGDWAAPEGTAWKFDTANISNDYTTTNLQSTTSLSEDDVVEVMIYGDKSATTQWLVRPGSGSGGSLVYATSPNTTLDASYTVGATFDEPAGTGTALATGTFYLSTPWNTKVTAPSALFAWWNKVSDNYYLPVESFFIKPSANYTVNTGVGTFTCYYNNKATLSLGTNTAFPSGVKAVMDGFDAANASSNSQAYFNGNVFPCSYDSANNIIYMDHPRF